MHQKDKTKKSLGLVAFYDIRTGNGLEWVYSQGKDK